MTEQTKTPLEGGASDGICFAEQSKDNPAPSSSKGRRLVFSFDNGAGVIQTCTVKGQTSRTLYELMKAGPKGVTALEVSTWALRLSAYIFNLRKLGLEIATLHEEHPEGWHGRYVLVTPVEILNGK